MISNRSYRIAFAAAIMLHLGVAIMLVNDTSSKQPVLMLASIAEEAKAAPTDLKPQEKAIKAVSINNNEVMEAVNQLKENRLRQQQAEEQKQQKLLEQAQQARKERLAEQQQLQKLKQESAKLAIAREKQLADEQLRLKQLAKQKAEEQKQLADIKKQQLLLQKQQKEEANKLAELKKKKAEELAQEANARIEKANAENKRQAAIAQAAADSERNARIAGEVDKFKALIVNAISSQWILPDNADRTMSSQFRIRLAPNGAVLDVSLTRSSGDPILDRSAQSAIYKASPLPVPNDPATFDLFRDISLTVRPENARG